MTRAELEFYSHNVPAIKNALERIANALEKNNKVSNELVDATTKDIPGFEGVLNDLDNLYQPTSNNPDPAGYGDEEYDKYADDPNLEVQMNQDEPELDGAGFDSEGVNHYQEKLNTYYEHDLQGIRVDSDHDIRSTAAYYEEALASVRHRKLKTKKDCILDYVTNEFGTLGARYTDIIKFAYYLGAHNAPKYDNSCRGYYAMAFNTRFGGHLVQGGKGYLVKGINNEGNERYFAESYVNQATDYWKKII